MNPLNRYRWPGESRQAYDAKLTRCMKTAVALEVDSERAVEGCERFDQAVASLVAKS